MSRLNGQGHFSCPKGRNQQLLYLDFDGVLHDEDVYFRRKTGLYYFGELAAPQRFLFEWSHLLVEWLEPYPQVAIVLTTSWVPRRGFQRASKNLPPAIKCRLVGATFHSSMDARDFLHTNRGEQVFNDLNRRRPSSWVALDDTNEGWEWLKEDRLVITHERLGLSGPGVEEKTKRLFFLNFSA